MLDFGVLLRGGFTHQWIGSWTPTPSPQRAKRSRAQGAESLLRRSQIFAFCAEHDTGSIISASPLIGHRETGDAAFDTDFNPRAGPDVQQRGSKIASPRLYPRYSGIADATPIRRVWRSAWPDHGAGARFPPAKGAPVGPDKYHDPRGGRGPRRTCKAVAPLRASWGHCDPERQ